MLSVADWTNGSRKQWGIIKITFFLACAMRLWDSLVTESKKLPDEARLLTVVSLEGPQRLASGHGFDDEPSTIWNLFSRSVSFYERSDALKPGLPNTS